MVISVGGGVVVVAACAMEAELPVVPLVACAAPPEVSTARTASEKAELRDFIIVILCIPLSAAAEPC